MGGVYEWVQQLTKITKEHEGKKRAGYVFEKILVKYPREINVSNRGANDTGRTAELTSQVIQL